MALKHRSTTAICASNARLVDEATGSTGGSAHLDLVLPACSRPVRVEAAALADREEEIVVIAVLRDEGGLLGMGTARLVRDPRGGCARGNRQWRVVHLDAVEVAPEGAKGHDDVGAIVVSGTVDGVVGAARLGGDACGAVVGPVIKVSRGCDANCGVLRTEGRNGVEEVVGAAELRDIRSLYDG